MDKIDVGSIGTGWGGGILANSFSASPLVNDLPFADIDEDRL